MLIKFQLTIITYSVQNLILRHVQIYQSNQIYFQTNSISTN